MMRAEILSQRQRVEFESADLVDLSWTPWRRVMLSSRENIWCLVDAIDLPWISEHVWNVWHAGGRGEDAHWQKYAKRNDGPARSTIRMHREILIRHDPRDDAFLANHFGDHGNGQTLDNRLDNLGWATKRQNNINRRARGQAPSLDKIVRDLIAKLGPKPEGMEVPF